MKSGWLARKGNSSSELSASLLVYTERPQTMPIAICWPVSTRRLGWAWRRCMVVPWVTLILVPVVQVPKLFEINLFSLKPVSKEVSMSMMISPPNLQAATGEHEQLIALWNLVLAKAKPS